MESFRILSYPELLTFSAAHAPAAFIVICQTGNDVFAGLGRDLVLLSAAPMTANGV